VDHEGAKSAKDAKREGREGVCARATGFVVFALRVLR
jgi:hypothetical protein